MRMPPVRLLRRRMAGHLRRWSAAVLDTGGDVAGGEAAAVAIEVTVASADPGPVGGRRLRDPVPADQAASATSGGSAAPVARPVEASTEMSPSGPVPTPGAAGRPAVGGTAPGSGSGGDRRAAAGDRKIRPCAPDDAGAGGRYDWPGPRRGAGVAESDRSRALPLPAG